MKDNRMFKKPDLLIMTPEEAKEAILILEEGYSGKTLKERMAAEEDYIPENIISLYCYYINQTDYQVLVKAYKEQYIENEALIEPFVTREEKIGLGRIYDFISNYDFANKMPNIFVDGLRIHALLYSACPHPEFGGKLRFETVRLKDSSYEVVPAEDARAFFQSLLSKHFNIDMNNILDYIDEVVKTIVDLIKVQPFADGNKRTFRALLNLMLGKVGIPPIYIKEEEKNIYREALLEAIETGNYHKITRFYYYRICDSIVGLDLNNTKIKDNQNKNSFIVR